jgi:hypothetical protein
LSGFRFVHATRTVPVAGWLGGTTTMWWSQADSATYRRWLVQAGLDVVEDRYVPEGKGGHALFWARRR